jgi:hypothetical protein
VGRERLVGREAGRQAHKPEGDKFQKHSFLRQAHQHQKPVLTTTNHSKETGARDTKPGNWVLKWTPNDKKLESLRRGRGWDAKERMGRRRETTVQGAGSATRTSKGSREYVLKGCTTTTVRSRQRTNKRGESLSKKVKSKKPHPRLTQGWNYEG